MHLSALAADVCYFVCILVAIISKFLRPFSDRVNKRTESEGDIIKLNVSTD